MAIHQTITADTIMKHENVIKKAPLVILGNLFFNPLLKANFCHLSKIILHILFIVDANFSQETIDAVLELCCNHNVPVFFEPTDPHKSVKALASPFATAIKYASPNIHELRFMAAESGQEHCNAASGKEGM